MTLRRLIKTGTACAVHWTGADQWFRRLVGSQYKPLVIGYHRVVEDFAGAAESSIPGVLISRQMLENQLDWIGRRFQFLSLDELDARLHDGANFNKPAVAITFDDGYCDFYYHAYPLFKRKGIPVAVFVVTDLIGSPRIQIHDKLYLLLRQAFSTWQSPPHELMPFLAMLRLWPTRTKSRSNGVPNPYIALRALIRALPQSGIRCLMATLEAEFKIDEGQLTLLHPLDWEMLAEMYRSGIIIGSHTKTHAFLANESRQKILEEIAGSREELKWKLGIEVKHFAYPDGQFNPMIVNAVMASGYSCGYAGCQHSDPNYPLLTIPRTFLWENSCLDVWDRFSPAIMSCQVNGIFDVVAPCREDHSA